MLYNYDYSIPLHKSYFFKIFLKKKYKVLL